MRYVVTNGSSKSLLISAHGPFPDLPSTFAFMDRLTGVTSYHELLAPPDLPAEQLVGVAEVAQLLGVSRQRVSQLARKPQFPAPVAQLAATKVWRADEVAAYDREHRGAR